MGAFIGAKKEGVGILKDRRGVSYISCCANASTCPWNFFGFFPPLGIRSISFLRFLYFTETSDSIFSSLPQTPSVKTGAIQVNPSSLRSLAIDTRKVCIQLLFLDPIFVSIVLPLHELL